MLWWVRAAIALAILIFFPGLREGFEPSKAAAVRVCGLALLAAATLAWRRRRIPPSPLDGAVAIWLLVEAITTACSESPLVSWSGEAVQREGFLTSLALGGIYFGARLGFAEGRAGATSPGAAARGLLDFAAAAAGLAGLYALAQSMGLDPIRWEDAPIYTGGGSVLRPFGSLGHPNLLGAATAATASASLALAVAEPRGRVVRALAGAVLTWVTLVTLSRAAWMGAAVGAATGVTLAAASRPGAGAWRRALLALAGLVAIVVVAVVASGWGERLAARARELVSSGAGSGASRLEIWRTALAAWRASPLLGHGPDTFELVFPRYQTAAYWIREWAGLPVHAHSIVLHTLATRGVIGLLAGAAWAACLAGACATAWRREPASRPVVAALIALVAAYATAGLFGALGIAGALLVAVASAAIAALASGSPPREPGPARAQHFAAGLVAALAVAGGLVDLRASAAARSAEDWLEVARSDAGERGAGARVRALEAADVAVRLAPLADAAHRLRAEALLGTAVMSPDAGPGLAEATREARRAVALVPARVTNHEQLARVLTARAVGGDSTAVAGAHQEMDRVAVLAPVNALLLLEGARLELVLGHFGHARARAARVAEVYPDDASAHEALAEAALGLGDREGATEALRRAFAASWRGDSLAMMSAERLRHELR